MKKRKYSKEDVMNSLETFVKIADQYKLIGLEKNNIYPMEIEILRDRINSTRSAQRLETMLWHIEAATQDLKRGLGVTLYKYNKEFREKSLNDAKGTITELASYKFLEEQAALLNMLEKEKNDFKQAVIKKKADLLAQRRKDFMDRKGEMKGEKTGKKAVQSGLERFSAELDLGAFKPRKKQKRRKR